MEYRNENNRTYNDGQHFVASYETGKAKFIGTYDECKKYIDTVLGGDDDEYGIFNN